MSVDEAGIAAASRLRWWVVDIETPVPPGEVITLTELVDRFYGPGRSAMIQLLTDDGNALEYGVVEVFSTPSPIGSGSSSTKWVLESPALDELVGSTGRFVVAAASEMVNSDGAPIGAVDVIAIGAAEAGAVRWLSENCMGAAMGEAAETLAVEAGTDLVDLISTSQGESIPGLVPTQSVPGSSGVSPVVWADIDPLKRSSVDPNAPKEWSSRLVKIRFQWPGTSDIPSTDKLSICTRTSSAMGICSRLELRGLDEDLVPFTWGHPPDEDLEVVLTPTEPMPGMSDDLASYRSHTVTIARVPSGTIAQRPGVAGSPEALNEYRQDDVNLDIFLDVPRLAEMVAQLLAAEANGSMEEAIASAPDLEAAFSARAVG